jgi:hypothetical protein
MKYKTLLLAISTALLVTSFTIDAKEKTKLEECKFIESHASNVMSLRQKEVSLSRVIEAANGNEFTVNMIVGAYESPHYSSKEYKERAKKEFANKYYLACFSYK